MKYKQMIQIGGTAATESLGSIIPPLPVDGEYTDISLSDVNDAEVALENYSSAVVYLNGVSRKLTKLRASMLSNTSEPLSRASVEAYSIAVESLIKPLGLTGLVVSAEGFQFDNAASLTYSAEGIKELVLNLIARIVKLIGEAVDKAGEYIKKFFDATENLKKRYDTLYSKAEGVGGRSVTTPSVDVPYSEAEWVMNAQKVVDVNAALLAYDRLVAEMMLGYPEKVSSFVRSIASVIAGWAQKPEGAKNPDAFSGIQPPLLHNVNPNSGVKTDFMFSPYRIHVNSKGLGTVDFTDAPNMDDNAPSTVKANVLQGQVILSNIVVARRIMEHAITAKNAIEGLTFSMGEYGKAVESLGNMTFEDEEVANAVRDRLVDVNASVRSWADLPIRVAAKAMHGVSSAEAIMSVMISKGYGKKDTDAGATGNAANATGGN